MTINWTATIAGWLVLLLLILAVAWGVSRRFRRRR